MYGVNISDLHELGSNSPPGVFQMLLCDFYKDKPTIARVGKNVDDYIVLLDGQAGQDAERVVALIEVIQTVSTRLIGRKIRCYKQGTRGGWTKIRLPLKSSKPEVAD